MKKAELDVESNQEENEEAQRENRHGIKVIGLGVLSTGLLIAVLGAFAETGTFLVSAIGLLVGVSGWFIVSRKGKTV